MNDVAPSLRRRVAAAHTAYRRHVEPAPNGLPRLRILLAFPALLLLVLIVFVALGLTGSSTGYLHRDLGTGSDPALIAGSPQGIRSDEWFVQTSWTISQVEQGLPIRNQSFPGGMDATVQHDLPSTDWSVAFRPHLLGFLVLPLDHAMALKWWLPGFAMMAAVYAFALTMLPRRPVASAALAGATFFAPYLQWWFLSPNFWTIGWAFMVMTTVLWLLRSDRPLPRILLPAITGYLTVTMGMGIYVPWIVPAVFVALAFSAGAVLTPGYGGPRGFARRLGRVVPLLLAGVVGVSVLVVWVLTRLDTIEAFTGTVYPGERLQPTGAAGLDSLVGIFSAPFTYGLSASGGSPINANESEASTFFMLGLFLLVPLVAMVVRDRRLRRRTDLVIVALLALLALIAAFLFIPGWDAVAHLLFLDRTTTGRLRVAFGLVSLVLMVVLARRLDDQHADGERIAAWPAWVAGALAAAVTGALAVYFLLLQSPIVVNSRMWIVLSVLTVVAVVLAGRGFATLASVVFLLLSLIGSAGVNPLYQGVWDTNDTKLVEQMKELTDEEPGTWVGVGTTYLPTIVLVQSGLDSLNGFQAAPSEQMWDEIDPSGRYEEQWNRLANVTWTEGSGEPRPSNPAPDQIRLQFDSCSSFAAEHVTHVLADERLDQPCLVLEERVVEGRTTFWIYDVEPAR